MPDNFYFTCPECRNELKLPPGFAEPGERIVCPACDARITVPPAAARGILARLNPEQWKKIGIGAAIVIVLGVAVAGFLLPDRDDVERAPAPPRVEPLPEERETPPPEPKWVPPAVQDVTAPETVEGERRAAEEARREAVEEDVEAKAPAPVKNGREVSAVPDAERKQIFGEVMKADERAGAEAVARVPDEPDDQKGKGGQGVDRKRSKLRLELLGRYMGEIETKYDLGAGECKKILAEGAREGWDGGDGVLTPLD